MIVTYNGVSLEIEHIARWDQRVVYGPDDADPLYIHHRLGVLCVFNPRATADEGAVAIASIASLRHRLLEPRKRLKVVINDRVGLELPLQKEANVWYRTDANNGPHPIAANVQAIQGTKTAIVFFDIEAYEPFKCPDKTASVLSHRWDMTHEFSGPEYYTSRTITGHAVFRTDLLLDANNVPDDFRNRLAHPVAANFMRQQVRVRQNSEGNAVDYTIVDVEQPLNLGLGSAVKKIEGMYERGYADEAWIGYANRYVSIHLKVYGNRTASKSKLVRALLRASKNYGFSGSMQPAKINPGFSMTIRIDVVRNVVELQTGYVDGGSFLRNERKQNPGLNMDITQDFPEDIPDVATFGGSGDNPLPSGTLARGTYLEHLVAQALNGKCDVPVKPINRTGTSNIQPPLSPVGLAPGLGATF